MPASDAQNSVEDTAATSAAGGSLLARWRGIAPESRLSYMLLALMLFALWTGSLLFLAYERDTIVKEERRELDQLRGAIAQHTSGLFHLIEADLRFMDRWLHERTDMDPLRDETLGAQVDDLRRISEYLIEPYLISTQGTLHRLPDGSAQTIESVGASFDFRTAMQLPPGEMLIGAPVSIHATGARGIPVLMRLTEARGGMHMVLAMIDLDRLETLHDRFRASSGSVALVRTDGLILSRTPAENGLTGRSVADSAEFAATLAAPTGIIVTDGWLTGGLERSVSYERLAAYPLIVAVSRTTEEMLADWSVHTSVASFALVCFSIMLALAAHRLMCLHREAGAMRETLQRNAAADAAAQNASPLGLFRTDASGRLVQVNATWRRIHGLADDTPKSGWAALLPDRDDAAATAYLDEGEHALLHPDGHTTRVMIRRADIVIDGHVVGSSGTVEDVTEQRAHQQDQITLSEILELSTDLIIQTNELGHCLYINPALRAFFGIAPDRPAGSLRRGEVAPEETITRWFDEILPAALQHGHWHGTTRAHNAKGEQRILSHLLIAHRDPAGQHHLFSSIMRDITEQMLKEQRLRDSERRLINIANGVPALIAELNDDYTYSFANRAYMDWLGVPPQQMLGHTVEEMLGSELFGIIGPYHAAAFRGEQVTYERIARNTGAPRWIRVTLVPRRGEDGRANGCYAIAFDITEQRQAEAALRHNERLLGSIADRLPMRVTYVDRQERFRFANLALEQALGQPRSAIYGRTIREVWGEAVYREVAPRVREALDGQDVRFEWEHTDTHGYRYYRADYRPLYGEDGREVAGLVSIVTDMTGQKVEERRLQALTLRDPLTGLLNRAGFDDAMHLALNRVQSGGGTLTLMYLDIDRFKQINDTLGHDTGDLLLQAFAGRLERILRASDVIARLGGDEFVVLLENCASAETEKVAANIVAQVQTPFVLEDRSVHVTTSIGVAMHSGHGALTQREFLRRADTMLYESKNAGRNTYRIEDLP